MERWHQLTTMILRIRVKVMNHTQLAVHIHICALCGTRLLITFISFWKTKEHDESISFEIFKSILKYAFILFMGTNQQKSNR